ncbi:putative membrane protein [Sinobacterium caligoides]|uniref:Putative membrane protein n=1 Tax=Sinobacterium caligoides TaxID=933926 RepID=A0A3N2DP51_9GAMM|nr:putative membrane protein [Sinobacterium caligoides]
MRVVLSIVGAVFILLYPLAIYFGLQHGSIERVALVLAVLFSARLLMLRLDRSVDNTTSPLLSVMVLAAGLGASLALLGYLFNDSVFFRYYPVLVNGLMAAVFIHSLRHGPPIIERLARLHEAELPESGVVYTRAVTKVWVVFFAINGAVALYTALWASLSVWTLYNGLLSYLLMGTLFVCEWLVRGWYRRTHD